ncbi:MAG: outer membrane beta-barrel protein [Flavobacteriales bacterium]
MRVLIALLVLTIISDAFGQVRVGQRGGVSLYGQRFVDGNVPIDPVLFRDRGFNGVGANGVVTVDIPLRDRIQLGTEVGYSERGYRLGPDGRRFGSENRQQVSSGHVGLAVLPKRVFGKGKVKLELLAGLDVSLRLNMRDETPNWILVMPIDTWQPFPTRTRADYSSDIDLSVVGGAGLVIGNGPVKFHICGRYLHGISNVFTEELLFTDLVGSPLASGSAFNKSFQASLGFSLPMSREGWSAPRSAEP